MGIARDGVIGHSTGSMLALCYGLWRGLQADRTHYSHELAPATSFWTGQHWRLRLSHILRQTTDAQARQFVAETVLPALQTVARELQASGVDADVRRDDANAVRLTVPTADQRDFVYGARVTRKAAPAFVIREAATPCEHVYGIITFFEDGRLGYDIEYLRGDEVIADVLRQYERYISLAADTRTDLLNRAPGHAGEME